MTDGMLLYIDAPTRFDAPEPRPELLRLSIHIRSVGHLQKNKVHQSKMSENLTRLLNSRPRRPERKTRSFSFKAV